jgi:hypothetical protein
MLYLCSDLLRGLPLIHRFGRELEEWDQLGKRRVGEGQRCQWRRSKGEMGRNVRISVSNTRGRFMGAQMARFGIEPTTQIPQGVEES